MPSMLMQHAPIHGQASSTVPSCPSLPPTCFWGIDRSFRPVKPLVPDVPQLVKLLLPEVNGSSFVLLQKAGAASNNKHLHSRMHARTHAPGKGALQLHDRKPGACSLRSFRTGASCCCNFDGQPYPGSPQCNLLLAHHNARGSMHLWQLARAQGCLEILLASGARAQAPSCCDWLTEPLA